MASDELKIRAMDGSALVVGRFELSGRSPQATAFASVKPGDLIGFSLPRDTSRRPAIRLHSDWRRADDGLYAAGPPAASVEFGDAMLNLRGLASSMFGDGVKEVFLRGDGAHLLTVRFLPVGTENALPVYGHIQEVTIEVARRKEGLSIRIDGPVQPFALEKDGPLLEDVHFDCEVVLPPAFCQLSSLGHYYGAGGQRTEWRAGLSGLAATPIAIAALGPGTVDWQQDAAGRRCKGPFVQTYLHEHHMIVRPSRRIWLDADGRGSAELDSDGPAMQIGFGRALLASLLANGDRAEVSFRTGIGHVDGQTGRSVGESGGPMRQNIRWLNLKLDRHPHELRIEGEGELDPLEPTASVSSLGPQLRFSFALSRTWLLACGIELPRFWDDWKRELGEPAVW